MERMRVGEWVARLGALGLLGLLFLVFAALIPIGGGLSLRDERGG
jgi:hypothetical protein